jgi:hypothetical protein
LPGSAFHRFLVWTKKSCALHGRNRSGDISHDPDIHLFSYTPCPVNPGCYALANTRLLSCRARGLLYLPLPATTLTLCHSQGKALLWVTVRHFSASLCKYQAEHHQEMTGQAA